MSYKDKQEEQDQVRIQERLEAINQSSDRVLGIFAMLVLIYQIVQSILYDHALLGSTLAVITAGPLYLTLFFVKNRTWKNNLVVLFAMFMVASGIASAKGLLEARNLYFLVLTALVLYQNVWLIVWAAILAIVFNVVAYTTLLYHFPGEEYVSAYMLAPADASQEKFFQTLLYLVGAMAVNGMVARMLRRRTVRNLTAELQKVRQLEAFEENRRIADEISKGNINDIVIMGQDDLGKSLRNMLQNLRAAAKREQSDRFVAEGINQVNQLIRDEDSETLFQKLLLFMCAHVEAQAGLLFATNITKATEEEERQTFHMRAATGLGNQSGQDRIVVLGEDLLGQACYQQELQVLEDIPEEYFQIQSGLGQAQPRYLALVPLVYNQEVMGGIELASFQAFTQEKQAFLNRAASNIASAILRTSINEQNESVLAEAEEKTQEFKEREQQLTLEIANLKEQVRDLERERGEDSEGA